VDDGANDGDSSDDHGEDSQVPDAAEQAPNDDPTPSVPSLA